MNTTQIIRDYIIHERLLGRAPEGFDDDFDLVDAAILDSLAMINLVGFLEEKLAIKIDDDDMKPAHFESVNAIARLVERKRT